MPSHLSFFTLLSYLLLLLAPLGVRSQDSSTAAPSASPTIPTTAASATSSLPSPTITGTTTSGSSSNGNGSSASTDGPPDVVLNVPNLSVGRIELDVDNLQADINLNAKVANLVSINAGVAISVQKINLTISDVEAELELIVRLGHLADIVNRVFQSLDLNPLLISAINNVTSLLGTVVGAVDGLLGTITQNGSSLSFLVDNLGNIVQQVTGGSGGSPVSSIVGDYLTNMTFTGQTQALQNGLTQKTYEYSPLNALVDIVFNAAGQVVQATVAKQTGGSGTTSSGTATSAGSQPSSTSSVSAGARR